MKPSLNRGRNKDDRAHRWCWALAALVACVAFFACAKVTERAHGPGSDQISHSVIVGTPANFDVALKENQAALKTNKIAPDIALYNIGYLLAHPSNPKKDYPRAIQSFQTLVAEHPGSSLVEPSKTWIQVL